MFDHKIGGGQYSSVYSFQSPNGSNCAFKINFKDRHLSNTCSYREIQITRDLEHSNIVRLRSLFKGEQHVLEYPHSSLSCDDIHFIFDREETDLESYLKFNRQSLTFDIIRLLMFQMLSGLEYVHTKGYIHRDIKSSNVLLSVAGGPVCKLCDFGLSKKYYRYDIHSPVVMAPGYRSPECAMRKNYDQLADCWSIGSVFYEMISIIPFISNCQLPCGYDDQNQVILQKIIDKLPYNVNHVIKPSTDLQTRIDVFNAIDLKCSISERTLIIDLIIKLLQFEVPLRSSASTCLSHVLFQDFTRSRQYIGTNDDLYNIVISKERTELYKYVEYMVTQLNKKPMIYVTHKNIFQALDNIDKMLSISSTMNAWQLIVYFLGALYLDYKSSLGTKDQVININVFLPPEYNSVLNVDMILQFEYPFVSEVLNWNINSDTIYNKLCDIRKPTNSDIIDILSIMRAGRHNRMSSTRAVGIIGKLQFNQSV